MKAILLVSSLAVAGTCFGQGTVNWQFLSFVAITAQTNSTQYNPLFGDGYAFYGSVGRTAPASSGLMYCYELLYNTTFTGYQAPAPNSLASLFGAWIDTGLTATNNNAQSGGRLSPVNPNVAAVVPWANGTTNNIVLVGWSANLGTSWAVVSNELANWKYYLGIIPGQAFFGVSATGYLTPNPSGSDPGATVFLNTATTNGLPIYSFNTQLYLLPVPEPGTLALSGLGGLSLLLFCHRRKSEG